MAVVRFAWHRRTQPGPSRAGAVPERLGSVARVSRVAVSVRGLLVAAHRSLVSVRGALVTAGLLLGRVFAVLAGTRGLLVLHGMVVFHGFDGFLQNRQRGRRCCRWQSCRRRRWRRGRQAALAPFPPGRSPIGARSCPRGCRGRRSRPAGASPTAVRGRRVRSPVRADPRRDPRRSTAASSRRWRVRTEPCTAPACSPMAWMPRDPTAPGTPAAESSIHTAATGPRLRPGRRAPGSRTALRRLRCCSAVVAPRSGLLDASEVRRLRRFFKEARVRHDAVRLTGAWQAGNVLEVAAHGLALGHENIAAEQHRGNQLLAQLRAGVDLFFDQLS